MHHLERLSQQKNQQNSIEGFKISLGWNYLADYSREVEHGCSGVDLGLSPVEQFVGDIVLVLGGGSNTIPNLWNI